MAKNDWFTKILAIVGTILVGLPVVAPIIFGLTRLIRSGRFMVDYLMPAEFGFLVLAGAILLIWAAIRARAYLKWIGWSVGIAIFLVVGGMWLATATGLADGSTPEGGWQSAVVYGGIIGYDLSVISLTLAGIWLIRKLFRLVEPGI
jgi:thiol:disulfide interchange protein